MEAGPWEKAPQFHWVFLPPQTPPNLRKATLADIVEQLQEKEAGPVLPVGVS